MFLMPDDTLEADLRAALDAPDPLLPRIWTQNALDYVTDTNERARRLAEALARVPDGDTVTFRVVKADQCS